VVTTTAAGGAEAVGADCGAVVPPDDARAVTAALERLRAGDGSGLAVAARAAAQPFTYERQVAGFERVYRRLPATRGDITLRNR
jgi:hypothetical protein